MNISRHTRSAFTDHHSVTVAANELARKKKIVNLFLSARHVFVFFALLLNDPPEVIGNDLRIDVSQNFRADAVKTQKNRFYNKTQTFQKQNTKIGIVKYSHNKTKEQEYYGKQTLYLQLFGGKK